MGEVYTAPPRSRNEAILVSIIEGTQYTDPPRSRIEDLLLMLKNTIVSGDVKANPDGDPTADLLKVKIDGVIYGLFDALTVQNGLLCAVYEE